MGKRGLIALVVATLTACSMPSENERLDDEAMKRARAANVDPEKAAYDWYYPKQVHNYFNGMDGVVLVPDNKAYQLLDIAANRPPDDLTPVDVIQLKDGDAHATSEVLGRNTWMMWAGGNEGFWDWLGRQYGFVDMLRLLDTTTRDLRFRDAGMINEPGMKAGNPDEDDLGLRLDVPADPEVAAWRRRYIRMALHLDGGYAPPKETSYGPRYGPAMPGDMAGYPGNASYDPRIPPPEIYGISSGVVGLRLFPNPQFDEAARKRWNSRKYYDDPIGDPYLVRPFRVGMACSFCHASYHPLDPPLNRANPEWKNISGNIGAQYLRVRAVFGNLLPKNNFIYHILDSQPPGTIDTSLIASDNINNPNTMNSVFNLPQRALVSFRNPKETISEATRAIPSIWNDPGGIGDATKDAPTAEFAALAQKYWTAMHAGVANPPPLAGELLASNDVTRRVPRILFDGADSIGAWGALARVYLNIGTNYEQWNTLHEPVVGFLPQRSFTIANVKNHSVYWLATRLRVGPLRDYFLKVTPPMPAVAAGTGIDKSAERLRPVDEATFTASAAAQRRRLLNVDSLKRGRQVFAHNCITCHSSVQPPQRHEAMVRESAPPNRPPEAWDHDPGRWLQNKEYREWAEKAVEMPEFWQTNYLSTDYRVPVSYVGTNACRAMATNAMTGNMWEDYSSTTYRTMQSVGSISFFNPYLGDAGGDDSFLPRHRVRAGAPVGGGGPGFYRVPTLVSIWATAPFLHNNSLGLFNNDPSIDGRLAAFDDGIRKLLWPELRLRSSSYNGATPDRLRADHGLIWRTTEDTYISFSGRYLPRVLGGRLRFLDRLGELYPRLRQLRAWERPIPSLVLFLIAFTLLWAARGLSARWVRRFGYLFVLLALVVGAVTYYLSGGFGGIEIGPIPKGTPVSLLASANQEAPRKDLLRAIATTRDAVVEIQSTRSDEKRVAEIMRKKVAPALMAVSRCPDFVMDRGHYFPWFDSMTDADKEALIELLKTF